MSRFDSHDHDDVASVTLSSAEFLSLADTALRRLGIRGAEVPLISRHLLDAAQCGYEFAGLPRVLALEKAIAQRGVPPEPRIAREEGSFATVEGNGNFGYVTVDLAVEWLIRTTPRTGVAVATVHNSLYSGRNAYFTEKLARAGLVGFYLCSSEARVAPAGGTAALLGTNPVSFAFPLQPDPVVIDFATSEMSWGDLELYSRLGREMPPGRGIDREGRPTVDAQDVLDGGAIFPFGGHKGYGLSLAMQLFGFLARANQGDGIAALSPPRGYFLLALDPAAICDADTFAALARRLVDDISAQEGARVPSARAFAERERRRRDGVLVALDVVQAVERIGSLGSSAG
jgi:LDH2 family malate/lactate/ureidoglycolate dehydrogenase